MATLSLDGDHVFSMAQLLASRNTKGYDGYALILSTSLQYEAEKNPNKEQHIGQNPTIASTTVLSEKDTSYRNLQGVLNDADKICKYLKQHTFTDRKTGKMYQVNVRDTWIQRSNEGGREMCQAIEQCFEFDYKVFILYYSGHGTKETGDWAVHKEGRAAGDLISLSRVLQLWEDRRKICKCCCCPHKCKCGRKRTKSSHLIIIADSCYSGAWVEALNTYHRQRRFRTVSMVASCKSDQTCCDTKTGGIFTKYLVGEEVLNSHSQVPQYTNDIHEILAEYRSPPRFSSLFQCCPCCVTDQDSRIVPANRLEAKIIT